MDVERRENGVEVIERLDEMIGGDEEDFGSWTCLISEIERVHGDNIDMLSLAYDSFLSKFVLCHWYWTKYAYHKARLCTVAQAVAIFERALDSTTFSLGFWLNYCNFTESFFQDPSHIRRVYERAFSFVGKDYNSHVLWDNYLRFEFSQQQWGILAHIYIRVLKFPTKGLCFYYDNFQKFVTVIEEEIKSEYDSNFVVDPDDIPIIELKKSKEDIPRIIKDLQDLSDAPRRFRALHKYKTIGNQFYQEALKLDKKIKSYEAKIQTNYFQERLIDDDEISNWHQYLDFIEKQEDFDWGLKLYERCLVSCAKYPEFWVRYIEFMETRRGRPLAIFALDRATKVFLKEVPQIHLFSARFKEQIGDIKGARDAYHSLMGSDEYLEYVVRQANMEKRKGNLSAASDIYEKALKTAVEQQKVHLLPSLYIHFYRLKYMITGSVDAAMDVIITGIQQVPCCRLLLEELIKFAILHDEARSINIIDSIVSEAVSPAADAPGRFDMKDKVDISCLYLEFVDLCGTLDDVKKAWSRHNKLFPHVLRPDSSSKQPALRNKSLLNEMKKQRESNPCTMNEQNEQNEHSVQVCEPLLHINNSTKVNQVSEDLSLQQGDGNDSSEKSSRLSLEVAPRSTGHENQLDGLNQNRGLSMHIDDASGGMNLAPDIEGPDIEAKSVSMETNHVLIQQHIENSPLPTQSTGQCAALETFSESLQHVSCSVDNHQDLDNELGHGPNMDSAENLSLDSEVKKPLELINESSIDEIPAAKVSSTLTEQVSAAEVSQSLEEQVSADPPAIKHSRKPDYLKTSLPYSADWQHGSYVSKPDDSLSSGHRENRTLEKGYPNSSRSSSPGGSSHLVRQSVERESGTLGNHSDSLAQQQQYVSGEMGRKRPMGSGSSYRRLASSKISHGGGRYHPGVAEGNSENSHGWTVNNVSQQSAVSANQSQLSSPPGNHPQSQEAVNQMLQYQYYQQQQQSMQQYEQQMWQMQQQYIQHQQQQQDQLQPQQEESQTSSSLLQQQQLQSLHQQQISYWQHVQQQPSQQANGHGQQMYQAGYQQQADPGYQLLMQQYQLQQQSYYYMMQQQHQQMQQQGQQEGPNNQIQQQQQQEKQHSNEQQLMDVE